MKQSNNFLLICRVGALYESNEFEGDGDGQL
jgi:hypothetical protein